MHIVPMGELLREAHGQYAVPAMNCSGVDNIKAVLDAAEALHAPVIIQTIPDEYNHATPETIVAIVRTMGRGRNIRAAVHLDHGGSYAQAVRCIQGGYTSVMFDGSVLPYEENIAESARVAALAHAAGITCEAELGTIGQTTETGEKLAQAYMTDPALAAAFVERTGVDCLAVAVGNAHGFYPLPPALDLDRLRAIAAATPVPLVMHGGTGIPENALRKAIRAGIAKVNFATVLRDGTISGIRDFLAQNPSENWELHMRNAGVDRFREAAKEAIRLCMAGGQA